MVFARRPRWLSWRCIAYVRQRTEDVHAKYHNGLGAASDILLG